MGISKCLLEDESPLGYHAIVKCSWQLFDLLFLKIDLCIIWIYAVVIMSKFLAKIFRSIILLVRTIISFKEYLCYVGSLVLQNCFLCCVKVCGGLMQLSLFIDRRICHIHLYIVPVMMALLLIFDVCLAGCGTIARTWTDSPSVYGPSDDGSFVDLWCLFCKL